MSVIFSNTFRTFEIFVGWRYEYFPLLFRKRGMEEGYLIVLYAVHILSRDATAAKASLNDQSRLFNLPGQWETRTGENGEHHDWLKRSCKNNWSRKSCENSCLKTFFALFSNYDNDDKGLSLV